MTSVILRRGMEDGEIKFTEVEEAFYRAGGKDIGRAKLNFSYRGYWWMRLWDNADHYFIADPANGGNVGLHDFYGKTSL